MKGSGSPVFQLTLCFILIVGCVEYLATTLSNTQAWQKAASQSGNPAMQAPICGKPDDKEIHIPPDWTTFAPPAVGQSYVDPVFGCPVKRLTNSSVEETIWDGSHASLMHYYSTLSPMNATDTMLMITSIKGVWRIKDTNGALVVPPTKMPSMNNGAPLWDASEGNSFYYTLGETLYKGTVTGNSVKSAAVHTFKEYRGIVSPATADLSQDGGHLALVGQNINNTMDAFVWSLSKKAKTLVYTTTCKISGDVTVNSEPGCLHKLLLTPDKLLAIDFTEDGSGSEQGLRLWDGTKVTHLQDRTNHIDTGYDLPGNTVFIGTGNSYVLTGEKNPCPGGWGLDVRELHELSSAYCLLDKQPGLHVSYRGGASQPWAAISFFDERKTGPELFSSNSGFQAPSPKNWALYEDEIMLARIDGGVVYRLAHARSRSAENYWAQPHAAISRDGKYVVFTSNMTHPKGCPTGVSVPDECTDVYLIKVH